MNIEKYFSDYFKELEKIENTMQEHYEKLSKVVSDEKLKEELESLAEEEKEHERNLVEAREEILGR